DRVYEMCELVKGQLQKDGFSDGQVTTTPYLNIRFEGTDNPIFVNGPLITSNLRGNKISSSDLDKLCRHYKNGFIEKYRRVSLFIYLFICSYVIRSSPPPVAITTNNNGKLKTGKTDSEKNKSDSEKQVDSEKKIDSTDTTSSSSSSSLQQQQQQQILQITAPVYLLSKLYFGDRIEGPALILQDTSTVVIDPSCSAEIDQFGNI
ncbi:hypothetical protein RFI_18371, partial [Reticulomyxa filosa]